MTSFRLEKRHFTYAFDVVSLWLKDKSAISYGTVSLEDVNNYGEDGNILIRFSYDDIDIGVYKALSSCLANLYSSSFNADGILEGRLNDKAISELTLRAYAYDLMISEASFAVMQNGYYYDDPLELTDEPLELQIEFEVEKYSY